MVRVDDLRIPFRDNLWCHMTADTVAELHSFARRLRLKRAWFQGWPHHSIPHYDLTMAKRAKAIQIGAVEVTAAESIKAWRDKHGYDGRE